MKIISYLSLFLLVSVGLSSCEDGKKTRTYAKELKAEKALIADYIERNGLKVVDAMPSTEAFLQDDKLYYKSTSGLYYRLEKEGEGTDTIAPGDKLTIETKYLEYTLTQNPDTADYWSPTVYPGWLKFDYGSSSSMAVAFLEAVSYMKRTKSEAKLIVPSKLGFGADQVLTPYGYKMKIRFRKNEIPTAE